MPRMTYFTTFIENTSWLGRVENEGFVDGAQALHLGFDLLEPRLELGSGDLHALDVLTSVKKRNLAGFLFGHREHTLQEAIAFPELIPPPLLGLDPLSTNGFAAYVSASRSGDGVVPVGVRK
ncbi:hypothetical protein HWV62_3997 [Athelia sp. TMB]|nr:hypothetical protein HWV62_3997 [Athelia sp. TMB]